MEILLSNANIRKYQLIFHYLIINERFSFSHLIDEQFLQFQGIENAQTRKEIIFIVLKNPILFIPHKNDEKLENNSKISIFDRKMVDWSVEDVSLLLKLIDQEIYIENFRRERIGGSELMKLDHFSLIQIGVSPLGHRKKILRRISLLSNLPFPL